MPPQTEPKRFQCRHIFTNGHQCGSPTLRHEPFCFYHHTTRKPVLKSEAQARQGHQSTFDLPLPEDRSAIQHNLGEIIRRLATHEIDPRRAGLILYALQIASLNLPRLAPAAEPEEATQPIESYETHADYGILAPERELIEPKPELSIIGQFLKELDEEDARGIQLTLPLLQAAEEHTATITTSPTNSHPTSTSTSYQPEQSDESSYCAFAVVRASATQPTRTPSPHTTPINRILYDKYRRGTLAVSTLLPPRQRHKHEKAERPKTPRRSSRSET